MITIPEESLCQLSEYLASHAGWNYPRERWRDLARGVAGITREAGFEDVDSCVRWLLSGSASNENIDILARHLTVGETYFVREHSTFHALETTVLKDIIQARSESTRSLRIWTPGCCTGEEPYSLAILLARMIPDLETWKVTIIATDINRVFLQKARDGVYGEWSFRGTPQWIKEKYFTQVGKTRWELDQRIRDMVKFSFLNLKSDVYPGLNESERIDLISCRNVLMYFVPEHADRIVERFYQSLSDPGWLIVSASETSHISYRQFEVVNFPGAVFFRKDTSGTPARNLLDIVTEFASIADDSLPAFFEPAEIEEESHFASFEFPELEPATENDAQSPIDDCENPYDVALARYQQGSYLDAAELLEAWLSANVGANTSVDQRDRSMTLLARAYANQGKLTEALKWCRTAISSDKLNAAAYYLLASILQEQGEVDEAISSLNKALYLDHEFVIAHFALGNILMMLGRSAESRRRFETAIKLLPNYRQDDVLPESEGITAGQLAEIATAIVAREAF